MSVYIQFERGALTPVQRQRLVRADRMNTERLDDWDWAYRAGKGVEVLLSEEDNHQIDALLDFPDEMRSRREIERVRLREKAHRVARILMCIAYTNFIYEIVEG